MNSQHTYQLTLIWTGNKGTGTDSYRSYERSHVISIENKPDLFLSADPAYRGDSTLYNPEELLLASLSGCHMLWFLHLCSDNGIVVTNYLDHPIGHMQLTPDGGGKFTEVTLQPEVTVSHKSMLNQLDELHKLANQRCFIANSVNFPVHHRPTYLIKE